MAGKRAAGESSGGARSRAASRGGAASLPLPVGAPEGGLGPPPPGSSATVKPILRLRDASRLPAYLLAFGTTASRVDLVRLLRYTIDAWDFEGSPGDPRAYEPLDFEADLLPIAEHVACVLAERLELGRLAVVAEAPNRWRIGTNTVSNTFTARSRLTLSQARRLPAMQTRYAETRDAADLVCLMAAVVDPDLTDLVPRPDDTASYRNLDLFAVVLPIGDRVLDFLNKKQARAA